MQTAQVIVTIAADGTLKSEVKGVQGQSCQSLTKPLEQLGSTTTTHKPEFYETASVDPIVNLGA
jgi:hypothetical protein